MEENNDYDFEENELDSDMHSDSNEEIIGERGMYLSGMYKNWFLDYASYVILERAVPYIEDGLKPVQRRILHSMRELDDGRFHKVANIIGNTMKYHPHGDASIGDALVQLGQKELLIEMQGNWGNIFTGDGAAAPRYIEAKLSKFALDVVFNKKTTEWRSSYDGRNKEPWTLPVKFPLLLAQGVEGIAVGLACKILPHNFNELIDASIDILKGKPTDILPDFPTYGMADFSNYNNGLRGGRVRIRAKIVELDKKTLVIKEIPFSTNTSSLIDSIVNANEKGKIKIRKIEDNTAEFVEIIVHLPSGVSPDKTIDALYAFTDCEISISPNACVIDNDKPNFLGVNQILEVCTQNSVKLLKLELEIRKNELLESLLYSSLEKIFIENRIYRDIEECTTWESVIETIDKGLEPYKPSFYREINQDDILKLTEIKIKRISKFDGFKADELMLDLQSELEEVENHLDHIIDFAINYFKQIKKKYGADKERRTEIRSFDTIVATKVVAANEKLYVNREEGFAGTGLKKDEFVCNCSDIDDIISFSSNGTFIVTKVAPKVYVGKNIIHIAVFKKTDNRTIYNMAYQDGPAGPIMVKRFNVTGVTRDKEYDLTKGTTGSKVLYFTENPNGEAEIVTIHHKLKPRLKKLNFDFDFAEVKIKNRSAAGNILTRLPIKKIVEKEKGVSTLGARKIWFDETVLRLNTTEYGKYLGKFAGDDKIIVFYKNGTYRCSSYDLSTHFEPELVHIEKYREDKIYTTVYWDNETNFFFVKRFKAEPIEKPTCFISETEGSYMDSFTPFKNPKIEIVFSKKNKTERENELIELSEFVGDKSYKAKGKRLTNYIVSKLILINPDDEDIDELDELEPIELTLDSTVDDTDSVEVSEKTEEEKNKELKDAFQMKLNFDLDE